MNVADIFAAVHLNLETGKFEADALKSATTVGGKMSDRIKRAFTGANVGTAIGAALGGITAAGMRMGEEVDNALDSIRVGTGATGAALKGLEGDFKAVASKVPNDIEEVGQAIADLNTRTGQTGEGLQDLAVTILNFSRITKSNVESNVRNATRVFGDWSIATEDQADALDKVFRASQATGIGVDTLMQTVVDFGSPLRLLGFQFEESIALLSKWEKEGVNTETALTGLKFSVKTLAREGVPAAKMAETLREKIAAIGKSADPVTDAIELFGLRAGPDLAAAIVEGRFATEDLLEVIKNGPDTIAKATEATDGFGEMWKRVTNSIKVNFGGLFTAFAGLGNLVYLLPAIGGGIGRVLGSAWTKAGGSAVVMQAVAFAGGKATSLYLAALIAGDKVMAALRGVWVRIAGSGVGVAVAAGTAQGAAMGGAAAASATATQAAGVAAGQAVVATTAAPAAAVAGTTIGRVMGTTAGRAAALAIPAALVLGLALVADDIQKAIGSSLEQNPDLPLNQLPWPLGPKNTPDFSIGPLQHILGGDSAKGAVTDAAETAVSGVEPALRRAGGRWALEAQAATAQIGVGIASEARSFGRYGEMITGAVHVGLSGLSIDMRKTALDSMSAFASGLLDNRTAVDKATAALGTAVESTMSRVAEVAKLIGLLTGEQLAAGMASKDGIVKAQAEATRAIYENRLMQLGVEAKSWGKDAQTSLVAGMASKDPAVRAQAERTNAIVERELENHAQHRAVGGAIVDDVTTGMKDPAKATALGRAARDLAAGIVRNLLGGITYGGTSSAKTGKDDLISRSTNGIRAFAMGTPFVERDQLAFVHRGEAIIPAAQNQPGGFSPTINLTVQGDLRARDEKDVVRTLQRAAAFAR